MLPFVFAVAAPPSAEQYYVGALERMRHAQEPAALRYHASISVDGGTVRIRRNSDGTLDSRIGTGLDGGKSSDALQVAMRAPLDSYVATLADGATATSMRPLFNATWQGIDDWIKFGLAPPAARAVVTPAPTAHPSEPPEPRVIAVVSTFGLANYRVRDVGGAPCANGDPGHAVALVARDDGLKHPLNYADIDESTGVFCTLRFNAPVSTDPGVLARASVELHLASIGGFYLVQDERVEMTGHLLGIQVGRVVATVRFTAFDFAPNM